MAGSTSSGVWSRGRRYWWIAALALVLLGGGWWWSLRRAAQDEAALRVWYRELPKAVELARRHDRPLHVHFTSEAAPLAARVDETLALEPVRRIAEHGFVSVRLDARREAALFRQLVGSAGVLASCVVDVGQPGELDPVAVAPGYLDGERYLAFLTGAAASLPRLRELRGRADGAARLALGRLYAAQGSAARARHSFETVEEPGLRVDALEGLARLDLEAGHVAQARRELDEAKRSSTQPSSPRLWLTEALVLSKERSVTAAAALLGDGLAAAPPGEERAQALLLLGQLEHELKRDSEAVAHLEQLARERPESTWSRAAVERIAHIRNAQPNHTH